MINTLPKPVLIALLYRLAILHLASGILPTIGTNNWESEEEVGNNWDDRPVGLLATGFKSVLTRCLTDILSNTNSVNLSTIHFYYRLFSLIA